MNKAVKLSEYELGQIKIALMICEFYCIVYVPEINRHLIVFDEEESVSADAQNVIEYLDRKLSSRCWLVSNWREYKEYYINSYILLFHIHYKKIKR